jgi:hypothetical protein
LVRAIVHHADPNTDAHSHADTITDTHTNTNSDTNANTDGNAATFSLTGSDVYGRAKIDADANSDADNHRRAGDLSSQSEQEGQAGRQIGAHRLCA